MFWMRLLTFNNDMLKSLTLIYPISVSITFLEAEWSSKQVWHFGCHYYSDYSGISEFMICILKSNSLCAYSRRT